MSNTHTVCKKDSDTNNADEHVTAFIRVVYRQFTHSRMHQHVHAHCDNTYSIRGLRPCNIFTFTHQQRISVVDAHTRTLMGELFVATRLSTTFFSHCSLFASLSFIHRINTNASELVSLEAAEFQGVFTVSTVRRSGSLFRICV